MSSRFFRFCVADAGKIRLLKSGESVSSISFDELSKFSSSEIYP